MLLSIKNRPTHLTQEKQALLDHVSAYPYPGARTPGRPACKLGSIAQNRFPTRQGDGLLLPSVPPSNLSCATAWAQRASRFPPLGGGEEPVPSVVDD
jgi:hypothetical protein